MNKRRGVTRQRKPGSKQPAAYWRRMQEGDKERWVHPATYKKLLLTGAVGIAGGLFGYFLPGLVKSLSAMFVLDFLKEFKTDLKNIFR
jgi:hypothetical protein